MYYLLAAIVLSFMWMAYEYSIAPHEDELFK